MPEQPTITARFIQERPTKNTVRYVPENPAYAPITDVIYIKKETVQALGNPQAITVTLTREA